MLSQVHAFVSTHPLDIYTFRQRHNLSDSTDRPTNRSRLRLQHCLARQHHPTRIYASASSTPNDERSFDEKGSGGDSSESESGGGGGGGNGGSREQERVLPYEQLFLKGPVPGDRIVRTISLSGEVSCRALTCTGLVSGAARLHGTSPVATTAFGRALACGLLLAAGKKDGEQLQIQFRAEGPMKGLMVLANGLGHVRGFMGNPRVDLPLRADGRLDVARAIGKGVLAVVRSSPMSKTPYTGLVNISSGEVAEDIAQYLAESEQTPSALAAGVYVESDGSVGAAAGFLMQLLPGASEQTVEIVERNVKRVGTPTELVRAGRTPEEVVALLMEDLNPMNVAAVSPRYFCPCGIDRVKRTLALLSTEEIRDILKKEGKIEATCEFCGQVYALLPAEVETMLEARASKQ